LVRHAPVLALSVAVSPVSRLVSVGAVAAEVLVVVAVAVGVGFGRSAAVACELGEPDSHETAAVADATARAR
jgi:hypothetical protein